MTSSPLLGRWRITARVFDTGDEFDLGGPAYISFGDTESEFGFACVCGSFGGTPASSSITFDWEGSDEMDEVAGDGDADLLPDGSLEGTIRFHRGDELSFKAVRSAISTPC